MPHENATATRLLATHCAVCSRPLVDAQSVETGIGPICRERYFGVEALTEAARVEANGLVYRIAAELSQNPSEANLASVSGDLTRLRELGANTIVDRILSNRSRLASVKIVIAPADPERFGVVAPRNDGLTAAFRGISSRRWYGGGRTWTSHTRLNVFHRSAWPAVRDALRAAFGDAFARQPNGDVIILTADAAPGFDVPEAPAVASTPAAVVVTITDAPARYGRYGRGGTRPIVAIDAPYRAEATADWRAIPSRRWNGSANTVDVRDVPAVLALVERHWPGATILNNSTTARHELGHAGRPTATNFAVDMAINDAVAAAGVDLPQPMANRISRTPDARDGWETRARAHANDELPAVEYSDTHGTWLAEGLAATLEAGGFRTVMIPGTTEVVYGLRLSDDRELLVYTSISNRRGGMVMRGRGHDAIRVATVRNGAGVASTTRVNRAGTINSIVNRVLDRAVELAS